MRRITELYSCITEDELHAQSVSEDGAWLDSEQDYFSEDERERILARASDEIQKESAGQKRSRKHLTRRKKTGALILAAALFTALTVSAAEYFQLKKELAFSLDIPSDIPPDQLSSMLMDFSEEEVSVTEHGVTVRAEQAICDGRAACICFEIELPDGIYQEEPDGEASAREIHTYWNGPVSWSRNNEPGHEDIFNMWRDAKLWIGGEETGCGPMIIEKSAEDPDRYYVILRIGLEQQRKPEGPQELKLMLTDLGYVYADSEKTEWLTRIEGTWTLEWTMELKDMSRTYEIGKEFQKGERSVFVENVQVSPLGIYLVGTTESEGVGGDFIRPDGILTRKGSAETEDAVSVWAVGEEGGTVTADGAFERLIEVNHIRNSEICSRPRHIIRKTIPIIRCNIREAAVNFLRGTYIIEPLCIKKMVSERKCLTISTCRSVAKPWQTFVSLRTIGRHASIISAYSPPGIFVYPIDDIVGTRKRAGISHLIMNDHSHKFIGRRGIIKAADFGISETMVSKSWCPRFFTCAFEYVCILRFCTAQVVNIQRPVRIERLGKSDIDLLSRFPSTEF